MVRRHTVSLTKHRRRYSGKTYVYWYLRWFGSDGTQHGQSIGRADGSNKLSKRQAELFRSRKEQELNEHPGRRDAIRAPDLLAFLETYLVSRVHELAPGTLELHNQTAKYMLAFFGESCQIDQISRLNARMFKTALANGDLKYVSKRPRALKPATVDLHIRNARTMLNRAVEDEVVLFNPFGKLAKAVKVEKSWYYVNPQDYKNLMEAAPNLNWRLLISLCRLAGLRIGEALNLEWEDIDWNRNCLRVIAKVEWRPKDRDPRTPPLCRELQQLLLEAYEVAEPGQKRVIGKMSTTNLHRDFGVIRRRAGINEYHGPFQTMRKNCYEDWAREHPAHVLKEWAGHSSLDVTAKYYLQVSELEYKRATGKSFLEQSVQKTLDGFAQKLAQKGVKKGIDKKQRNRISLLQKKI